MKRIVIAAVVILSAFPLWAKVGKHNFLVNLTAGPSIYSDFSGYTTSPIYSMPSIGKVGVKGLVGLELAYLMHPNNGNTIHGMDLRVSVLGDVPTSGYGTALGLDSFTSSNPILLSFSLMYTPGLQLGAFRLLFDAIGINISLAFAKIQTIDYTGSGFFFGYNMTLPLGFHFLFNNGVYFAVRHHIIFNPYSVSPNGNIVKYAVMFSFGFAIGK